MELIRSSMEFHGPFPGHKGSFMEFHGTLKVPWDLTPTPNPMGFHGILTPRKHSMEFRGILEVPWN